MLVVERYDPRKDKEALKEIMEDFLENKTYFFSHWQKFEEELNKRVLDLKYRNSMVVAKDGGQVVGWGTYTIFKDYLGNERVLVHQVLTRKEDSYKKGIEEKIILELQSYIKKTLGIDKTYYICPDSDGALRSIFMKRGINKSKFIWYEKEI